jgi:hypothetical protein
MPVYLDHNKEVYLAMTKPEAETVKDCNYPGTWLHLTSDGAASLAATPLARPEPVGRGRRRQDLEWPDRGRAAHFNQT